MGATLSPAEGRAGEGVELDPRETSTGAQTPRPSSNSRVNVAIALATLATATILGVWLRGSGFTPTLRIPVGQATENAVNWFIDNCAGFYVPVGNFAGMALTDLQALIDQVPDPVMVLTIVAICWAIKGWRLGAFALVTLSWVAATGLWSETLQTLSLVAVAVVASAAIGYIVGGAASFSSVVRRPVFLVVDAMQTIPVFVYLLPVVLIFGPGDTGAVVVTLVYATPPMVRMTELGLRSVPAGPLEAATSTGATTIQILRDVKFPMAISSVRVGLNQTIMLAVAMSVVAAMIGASGLGDPVWRSLQRLEFGLALDAGIVLVLVAVLLDRLTSAPAGGDPTITHWTARRRVVVAGISVAAGAIIVGAVPSLRYFDLDKPLAGISFSFQGRVEGAVDWLNIHGARIIDPLSESLIRNGLQPLDEFLLWIPWYVVACLVLGVAIVTNGWRNAVCFSAAIVGIGFLGLWAIAATTVSLVGISSALALAVGIPLGVLMSLDLRIETLIRPVLDVLQTMPIYVFVIPAVVIMGTGTPAGILAIVLYVLAPSARFTCAALKGVPTPPVEAATAVGGSDFQTLRSVRFPLGLPTIIAGVNQTILMAMAMAVVASLIGAPGLGRTILTSLTQLDLATGVNAGLCMLILAVVASQMLEGTVRGLRRAEHLV